jgi:hypothetical protein
MASSLRCSVQEENINWAVALQNKILVVIIKRLSYFYKMLKKIINRITLFVLIELLFLGADIYLICIEGGPE